MSKVSYPRRKVFFAFFFCPLMLGLIVGVVKFVALLVHLASNARLMGEVRGTELVLMPIAAPLIAQVVFLLPFLGFAALIALKKIHRTTRNCVVISLTGGLGYVVDVVVCRHCRARG
ncbi:hypothetical protein [Pseudomonas sp. GM48]|uniref:hypothetical protein n=1 Tax=Pseudomonas sp. GM48 TaxID=1144330 RepID=UPI00027028D5|nr:hypothetical protein [Pseudomonas sp. GM48]EJM56742.1 hypothetical protein PMI28_02925 [Pseudomonas sp. GM48]